MIDQIGMSGYMPAQGLSQTGGTAGIQGQRPDMSQMQEAMEQVESTVSENMGLDAGTLSSLRGEIETAVSSAMEQADGSSDPRETVDAAVRDVFEANGIDFDEFQTQMETVSAEMGLPAGPPGGMMGGGPGGMMGGGRPGGPGGMQGMGGVGGMDASDETDSTQSLIDMLSESSESEDEASVTSEILNWLRNLPAGSCINVEA